MTLVRPYAFQWRTYLAGGGVVLKAHRLVIILSLAAAALVSGLISNSRGFQECIEHRKSHGAYRHLHDESGSIIKLITRLKLDTACTLADSDALVALSGCAVAFFTFALWRSTHLLWKAGERQLEIAQQSITTSQDTLAATLNAYNQAREIATLQLRPWVSLHLEVASDLNSRIISQNPKIAIVVKNVFMNKGSSAARSVVVRAFIRQAGGSIPEWLDGLVADGVKEAMQNITLGDVMLPSEVAARPEYLFLDEEDLKKPAAGIPVGTLAPVIGVVATYRPLGLSTDVFYTARAWLIAGSEGKAVIRDDLPVPSRNLTLREICSAAS